MGQKTDKLFERAKVNLDEDNLENALRLFNEVLNREPSHKKALRNKGLIKVLYSPMEEAEEFLLFAIDQQPEDDQLYQLLGTLYHNNEKPQKAISQFKKAIEIDPANQIAQQGLGMIYAHVLGEHEHAITHFSKAIEAGESKAELFFNRGCSYMLLDKREQAEQDLREAAKRGHAKSKEMVGKYFS